MKYYKAFTPDGKGPYERTLKFSLPAKKYCWMKDSKPGLWHTVVGPLKMCRNGFHVATESTIKHWVRPVHRYRRNSLGNWTEYTVASTRRVFEVEVLRGCDRIRARDKICVRTMRVLREVEQGSTEWISLGLPIAWKWKKVAQ